MADNTESRTVGPSSLADPRLLDKIDKLFALNIGEHVELPQLVVVGDQSRYISAPIRHADIDCAAFVQNHD